MSSDVRQQIAVIHPRLTEALKAVEQELGIKIGHSRVTYSRNGSFTLRVEAGIVGADGKVASKEAEAWPIYAPMDGLKVEWLGQTFSTGGATYRITGYRSRSRKAPVLAERTDNGKTYVFPSMTVKALFSMQQGVKP